MAKITLADKVKLTLAGGGDLVVNGDFSTVTTGWSATACTVASVVGGESGNCLEITRTSATGQYAFQVIVLTEGKRYKASVYVKSGTSGNETFKVSVEEAGLPGGSSTSTTTAGWVQHTFTFKSTGGANPTMFLWKRTDTAGTMLFDSVTLKEIPTKVTLA